MYNIGDRIVYPMHGAGVIEAIEEKEILGQKHNYYVVKMPITGMKVMIPTENSEGIGIREVINVYEADRVLEVFGRQKCSAISNWSKRYRENMTKIRSGDIYEVADVVRSLMLREKEKGLSTGERKMLNSAKQILLSELILAKDIDQDGIEIIINNYLGIL